MNYPGVRCAMGHGGSDDPVQLFKPLSLLNIDAGTSLRAGSEHSGCGWMNGCPRGRPRYLIDTTEYLIIQ